MSRTPRTDGVRIGTRLLAGLTAVVVISGCAVSHPNAAGRLAVQQPAPAVTAPAFVAPFPGSAGSPSPSPTPTPTPSQTPTAPPAPADPFESLSPKTRKEFKGCLTRTVGPGSAGKCAVLVQKKLRAAGYHPWRISGVINTAGVNALLNYQRSRGIKATGTTTKATWVALATKTPALPTVLPKKCTQPKGVVLCVDQAHRRLFWLKNGKVVKSFKVRLGGWTYHPKTKKWRVFPTANGTWKVYDKQVDPPSENYGRGAMPYSTMFYPDMYVHYSPGFHSVGYSQSSHGCVNIGKLSEAIWIFKHTPIGARVHIFSPKAA